jgi:hypothetical protein
MLWDVVWINKGVSALAAEHRQPFASSITAPRNPQRNHADVRHATPIRLPPKERYPI